MRSLDLSDPPEVPDGIVSGDWVHTSEAIVVAWFGPCLVWSDVRKRWETGTSNCHQVEGEVCLPDTPYGPTFLRTNLWKPGFRSISGCWVEGYYLTLKVRPSEVRLLRKGPLPKRKLDVAERYEFDSRGVQRVATLHA